MAEHEKLWKYREILESLGNILTEIEELEKGKTDLYYKVLCAYRDTSSKVAMLIGGTSLK